MEPKAVSQAKELFIYVYNVDEGFGSVVVTGFESEQEYDLCMIEVRCHSFTLMNSQCKNVIVEKK